MDSKNLFLRDLGDGLVMRRSTPADAEALSTFSARIHSDQGPDEPDERVGAWVRDLLEKPHPTFDAGDFTIVEDTRTGEIVSSLNLISQVWRYAGTTFGVGRPELVGTLPEYRKRGLIRAQFEVIHQWSAERGELVQGITGIPYYYRIFGYEMAMNLGGGRRGYKPQIPKLDEGQVEPYRVRPARAQDLPFIAELYDQSCQRSVVSCVWTPELWQYELEGKRAKNVNRMELCLVEAPDGGRLGFLAHPAHTWGSDMVATAYELKAGISYGAVTPSVVRYLYAKGEAYAAQAGKLEEMAAFGFGLGAEHPVYQTMINSLPSVRKPYAWYLRVPDLPGFLRHIAPALEKRLEGSPYAGHSGELRLTFYRDGVRLEFEAGRLVKVEAWQPEPQGHSGEAAFPGLTFLQLLFGYRTLEELGYAFADCWWKNDQVLGLLNALFPKQASNVWPVS
ncbi:MAG: GNAT family N-acetyltransferase [Chloroflexota bacterium]